MLNTSEFLHSLSRIGLSISLANDRLKITPVDLLTDEIRNGIKEHKAEIMASLSDSAGDMLKEALQEAQQGPPLNRNDKETHSALGRTWKPGNPFVCECGFSTGWLRDGKVLCPMCDGKRRAAIN